MLSLLLSKIGGYLAAAGGLVLVILGALGMARRSGVKAEQEAEKDKALQQGKEAGGIDDKIRATSDDDLAKRLSKYQRD